MPFATPQCASRSSRTTRPRRKSSTPERLARAGVDAEPEDVLTSALAAAVILHDELPAGARVFACAGAGVIAALTELGFEVVTSGPADAVVVGWHDTFDFAELTAAARIVRSGALFVATNGDPTYPAPEGFLPGCGALVTAVATAAGRDPVVAGKPEAAMVALARRELAGTGIMVGDRPSTDGAFAQRLRWPFALVLSGAAGPDGEEAIPEPAPAIVADDLRAAVPDLLRLLTGR